MQIQLFQNSAERVRLDKSNYLANQITLNGTLRDSASVLSPTVRVQSTELIKSNYAYIPDLGRYYFITSINIFRTGVYDISMKVDVLMSHKEDLLTLNAFIDRNQYANNKYIKDNLMPINYNPNISYRQLGLSEFDKPQKLYFCVNIITNEGFGKIYSDAFIRNLETTNGLTSNVYLLDIDAMNFFYAAFLANNAEYASYVLSIFLIPFNISDTRLMELSNEGKCGQITNIKIGTAGLPIQEGTSWIIYTNRIFDDTTTISIDRNYKDYRDYAPFTKYQLSIPLYGEYELDISKYLPPNNENDTIYIEQAFDLQNGSTSIFIYTKSYHESITFTILPKIPLNYDNSDEVERRTWNNALHALGSAVSSVGSFFAGAGMGMVIGGPVGAAMTVGAASSAVAGGISAGLNAGANEIMNVPYGHKDIVSSFIDSIYQYGSIGMVLYNIDYNIYSPNEIDEQYSALVGKPSKMFGTLANFEGFTVIGEMHLENIPNALSPELDELDNILKTGVILP